MTKILQIVLVFCFMLTNSLYAWDGYNDKGESIEIDSGNLVRPGTEIEVYNYNTGEYSDIEVESMNSYGGSTEIEGFNYNTGEYETLEME